MFIKLPPFGDIMDPRYNETRYTADSDKVREVTIAHVQRTLKRGYTGSPYDSGSVNRALSQLSLSWCPACISNSYEFAADELCA